LPEPELELRIVLPPRSCAWD